MPSSAVNLYNQSFHKVPQLVTVFAKVTAAADVNANGYTINLGTDLLASVAKSAEGIMVVTTKFPWKQLVGVSILPSDYTLAFPRYTSDSASAGTVTFTWESDADRSTDVDPDAAVFWLRLDFNLAQVSAV